MYMCEIRAVLITLYLSDEDRCKRRR